MVLKAIIVDDEKFARDDLRYLLQDNPQINIIGEADGIDEAEKILASVTPDVVFLDIQLRGGIGFDLIPFIRPETHIIFITAHNEYAVRAFEVNAIDYILKPITKKRLNASLDRLFPKAPSERKDEPEAQPFNSTDHIYLKTDEGHQFVFINDIIVIRAEGGNYSNIQLKDGRQLLVRRTLKEWQQLLPDPMFIRIHRSTLINTSHIQHIKKEKRGGNYVVTLADHREPLEISFRMEINIKQFLSNFPEPAK
ncbi:LytTR family DNA-binding domain-containing protein [bacterium]|nr:LytTR family DNA-binding domain-containing protein [bacterium]